MITSILFLSCKNDNHEEIIKSSKNPDIDMVFYAVVKAEVEYNPSIEIIDRAKIESSHTSKSEKLFWNQKLFPNSDFINCDSLISSTKDIRKYTDFIKQHKDGWIELSKPTFSGNKAAINVDYTNGYNHFGWNYTYFLEKKNKRYIIVKKERNSIS